jgi:hypothetical protein
MSNVAPIDAKQPFPKETQLHDDLVVIFDKYRGSLTYAQFIGIMELIKGEILDEALDRWDL